MNDEDLLKLKLDIFRALYHRSISEKKRRSLNFFLDRYVRFAKPETNVIFEKEIQTITENKVTMGIEEMVLEIEKAEAKTEAKVEIIKNLIIKMNFSNEQAADIAGVPTSLVKKVRRTLKK